MDENIYNLDESSLSNDHISTETEQLNENDMLNTQISENEYEDDQNESEELVERENPLEDENFKSSDSESENQENNIETQASSNEEFKNLETSYAIAWSENQGSYSEGIAKKTLNFAKLQGIKINTVLDICCGSANFLREMRDNGKKCTGTEILDSYIEYNKKKYSDIEFYKTEGLLDFDNLGTFDLITCNHDVINFLPTIESWGRFFRMAYRHLNNGGVFIFDFYTKRKLKDWNEVTYDENEKLDYIRHVVSNENSTKISNIYYINLNPEIESNISAVDREYKLNNHEIKYKRTENSDIEYFFENSEIINEIKKAGYRYLITVDANFNPISSIDDQNRLHIIAIKYEK